MKKDSKPYKWFTRTIGPEEAVRLYPPLETDPVDCSGKLKQTEVKPLDSEGKKDPQFDLEFLDRIRGEVEASGMKPLRFYFTESDDLFRKSLNIKKG